MFIKSRNPFAKYIGMFSMFGSIVNMEDETGDAGSGGTDPIGGRIGDDGNGSDNMNSDLDGDGKPGDDDKSGDDKSGDDKSGDDKSGDDKSADAKSPNYEDRFSSIESNFQKLFDAINTNSDDDGKSGKDGDLSGLEHEDLVAMMADDPSNFIEKLTGVIEKSVSSRVATENANAQRSKEIEKTIDVYADANPDFEQMWDKGELQAYMEKNPGHNAISAHMAMTMENRIAEAEKRGAEKAIKNFRNKSRNQLLNGGGGIPPEQRDAALKNPSKFGGRSAVIAARAGITS